jgi:hypothetical protein
VAIAKGSIERVVAIICRIDKELIMGFIYINDQLTIGPDNGYVVKLLSLGGGFEPTDFRVAYSASVVLKGINEGRMCHYSTIWKEVGDDETTF